MQPSIRHTQGFTVVEITLSFFTLAVFAMLTFGVFHQMRVNSGLQITVDSFVHMNRRAQILARSGLQNDDWSVRVTDTEITLFKGDDYLIRDQEFDEIYTIPANITVYTEGVHGAYTVLREYTYEAPRALPVSEGSMIFESQGGGLVVTITINDQGTILY